ncbi:hypothetical protein OG785_14035 [Streptomyces sp. NBC_00006]|uniref:hypothetical protein n=1 Tax=Streptomyces sp. NBC_00006 TaxID=2975619 RepID=UPI0022536DFF|nr:hypothetical protein [Streptomyces sp. NBC_00006]MCX5531681.1 hypothetical protein [Streptomyces sp. NBC_00006]
MTRRVRPWVLVGLASLLLTGCGIRPTEVPTDFGAAPTRVGCSLSGSDKVEAQAGGEFPVQVYLVCTSQLVTVDRTITLERGQSSDRVMVARELLAQLAATPSSEEKAAGYTTDVRSVLKVSGPREGDPADALRLNAPPADLSPYALAQVICTFANSEVTAEDDEHVVLGGPDDAAPREYTCSEALKARPGLIPAPTRTLN